LWRENKNLKKGGLPAAIWKGKGFEEKENRGPKGWKPLALTTKKKSKLECSDIKEKKKNVKSHPAAEEKKKKQGETKNVAKIRGRQGGKGDPSSK